MTYKTLSHSDRIVVALAKLPISRFGARSTREVALVLATFLRSGPVSAAPICIKTIATMAGFSHRTVQRALKQLEEVGLFKFVRSVYGITPQFLGTRVRPRS